MILIGNILFLSSNWSLLSIFTNFLLSRTQFNAPVSQISFSNKNAAASNSKDPSPSNRSIKASTPSKVDVDTFVPEDGDFDNFLDETDSARSNKPSAGVENNDDTSDDDGDNPMVAKFQDDDSDVEIDNYEVTKVKDLSEEDSDNESKAKNGIDNSSAACDDIQDDLDNFFNDDSSCNKDYEQL